ncbi:MAG: hypothetical protein ATN35_03830 [Epulopiscium sp. Nele67-Bin004]|nr:MAG: hypothetical protein ATN35_03830 [Epulopiscium sp. Nele67-Bin004]
MHRKDVVIFATIALFFVVSTYILSFGSISDITVEGSKAEIIINFILPMDQDTFLENVTVTPAFSNPEDIQVEVRWIDDHIVALEVTELGDIKGQTVKIEIDKAPTQYAPISKHKTIMIDFKTEIEVVAPTEKLIIATDHTFEVEFNTPIKIDTLRRYIDSEHEFEIEAINTTRLNSTSTAESTIFKFTPVTNMENNREYVITFKAGLISSSGDILDSDQYVTLETDKKPQISKITPPNDSNWIGIYPKVSITSDTTIQEAYLYVNDKTIVGQIIDEHRAVFYFNNLLSADTLYEAQVQIVSPTGEKSDKYDVHFTTVPIKEDRIWIAIHMGEESKVVVYRGQNVIKQSIASIGTNINKLQMGTYYVLEKGESFYDSVTKRGASNWLKLSEGLTIHGVYRDEYWNVLDYSESQLGKPQYGSSIILPEDMANWLVDNIAVDTMVVILD